MTEGIKNLESDLIASSSVIQRGKRQIFSANALQQLEKFFALNQYPSTAEREQLALNLNTAASRILFWFQNQRVKIRKQSGNESIQRSNRVSKATKPNKKSNSTIIKENISITDNEDSENNTSQSTPDSSKASQHLNASLNDSAYGSRNQSITSSNNNPIPVYDPFWFIYTNASKASFKVDNFICKSKLEKPLFRPYL